MAGLIGVALYLGAYGALQLGFLRGSSLSYTVLNLCAAAAVLISLGEAFNLSSAIIQIAWIALSIIGLGRRAWLMSHARFTDEEHRLLAGHFPALPPHQARALLTLGRWESVGDGTALARQGAPVGALIYIGRGAAMVRVHGHEVARLGPGDLVGEITVIHDGGATADVTMDGPGRVFRIARAQLLREMAADHDFAMAISGALQLEAQRKFESVNRRRAAEAAASDDPPGPL